MEQIKYEKAIRYVLRYAINHDGIASYNPCMYDLGFADNIPPSEDFNRELKKFGRLQYGRNLEEDEYYGNYGYDIWNYFQIDERGKKYIKEFEPSRFAKTLAIPFMIVLSILQIPFVIEGWISFFLNCIIKILAAIFFPIALISFIWWPLDMLCGFCWMLCDWIKRKLWDKNHKWEYSARRWVNIFPEL